MKPKRPTVGKEKLGITFSGTNHGRDSEPTNRVALTPESAQEVIVSGATCRVAQLCARRGVAFLVIRSLIGEAECVCILRNRMSGILQVRVCGEGAG